MRHLIRVSFPLFEREWGECGDTRHYGVGRSGAGHRSGRCHFRYCKFRFTLVSNRLKEVEVVMKSEALLIGNRNLSEEKQEILRELLFRMDAVKTAEDKKYVLMNAPKEKLDEIVSVLPGMKSPTVMPLAQEGWCSVHTVLDEKCFWEIIGKLKALGAEGILVLPIEKMII